MASGPLAKVPVSVLLRPTLGRALEPVPHRDGVVEGDDRADVVADAGSTPRRKRKSSGEHLASVRVVSHRDPLRPRPEIFFFGWCKNAEDGFHFDFK